MVKGYVCKCGNKHLIEEEIKENHVKLKQSCRKCRKIKRLRKKANQRGKNKNHYLEN